jgi:hypothetical protein
LESPHSEGKRPSKIVQGGVIEGAVSPEITIRLQRARIQALELQVRQLQVMRYLILFVSFSDAT